MMQAAPISARDLFAAIAALVDSGKPDEAERQVRELLRDRPDDNIAWRALGYALLGGGKFAEAEAALLRAVALAPADWLALEHLGWLCHRTNRLRNAVAYLEAALAITPDRVRAMVILGNVLVALGAPQRALPHFERALELEPDHFRAHNNLANVLVGMQQLERAAAHYVRAAALSPDLTYQVSAAHLTRRICDWTTAEEFEPKVLAALRRGLRPADRAPPFPLLAIPGVTARDQRAASHQLARHHLSLPPVPHRPAADFPDRPLRIGYLSPDFRDHAITFLFVEIAELHDRSRFEIVAFDYSQGGRSRYRDRVLGAFDKVVPVAGLSDQEAARRIADEGVAIAVDLAGWTTGSRSQILAHRPAPVSVQWLGFPGTMGAPWIDYVVTDPAVAPHGAEQDFSEKLLRLPHSFLPNDRQREIGPRATRAEAGLPDQAFVFCCFGQPFKITREIFALWMGLLRECPDAVLWLVDDNPWATAALRERTREHGIAPERVIFAPRRPQPEYLAKLGLADLALDTLPYGGGTTACDALWTGTPHLALRGATFTARMASSILTAIGLPELIADDLQSYRDLALRLAKDRAQCAAIRARLAANRLTKPLFDSRLFARHLEAGYDAIWRRCRDGLKPDHIDVPPATRSDHALHRLDA